jgi:glycosyltransferase involved in cell wall biosynthesis
MKIIYLSPHPNISMHDVSGPGVHIREVMRGFEQHGHEVIWASPNKRLAKQAAISENGFSVFIKKIIKAVLPKLIWESLSDLQLMRIDRKFDSELQKMIDIHKPDFIYERSYYMMGCGYRTANKNGLTYLVEINSPYTLEKPLMSYKSLFASLAERNERKQLASMNQGFVVSSSLRDYFIHKYPFSSGKITLTPNAVRKVHTEPVAVEVKLSARKELLIDPSDIVITFVGSIFPYHGVDILINAFHDIRSELDVKTKLLVIGDGEILSNLKALANKLGITNHVIFTGNVSREKVREYLSASDIAIQAKCTWYNSPIKLFEYGARRLAIIAPNYPGVKDVMTDGVDGLLVDSNKHSLAQAIRVLIEQPKTREQIADSFYQRVKTHYTWENITNQILTFSK